MPDKTDTFPNAWQAIALVWALFMMEYLLNGVLYDLRDLLGLEATETWAIVTVLANGCIFTAIMHFRHLRYGPLFHAPRNSPQATFMLLLLPVLALVPALVMVMSVISEFLVQVAPMSDAETEMFSRMAGNNPAAVILAAVLAPVLEEMLFRGLILRSFLRQYPRWPAIAGSALIFGAAHMNLYQLVVATLLGLVLGWLYERSKSLIPCITLHAAYNSTLVVMESFASNASASTQNDDTTSVVVWLVVAALLALAGVRALQRLLPR